ncbi:hypothetical protein SAMN02745751_02692 [Dethiosulfatibacter aminovorans DSM 17477]|uniref:Uncharacterized protein n=1 Tax=Dethiosulfatibacter aminovorans DSM 17477 TaxID=1121476 RepID=A0A1M6JQ97_9FIRM|nr:hypothetical protein [Dethiosulfatibacter aminovorans]SHJ48878.1 hypothetical protein SAMN02745751_02692 [Dethiosulfatibacter aminovorans DSM 17477]
MEYVAMGLLGFGLIFVIVANAVKMGTREALQEFKDELIEEFDIQRKE